MSSVDCLSGSEIRELRKRLGLTQKEFAHELGVTFSTLSRWENGRVRPSKMARRLIDGLAARSLIGPRLRVSRSASMA